MDGRSLNSATTGTTSDQSEEVMFACNICFHAVTNPVATACGHLFCWRCLYEWLLGQARPCPVCRMELIQGVNIIPLYTTDGSLSSGAAATTEPSGAASAIVIPQRPHPPSPDHRMRPIPLPSPPGESTPASPASPRRFDSASLRALDSVATTDRVVQILDDLTDNYEIFRERVDQLGRDYLGSVRQNTELREKIDRLQELLRA